MASSDRITLDELIAALERAEGPSRELDAAIVTVLYPRAQFRTDEGYADPIVFHAEPLVVQKAMLPRLTASLDAALTLVPEGGAIESMAIWPGIPGGCYVTLIGTHERNGERWHESKDGRWPASHKNAAIALCIAALCARKP